MEDNPQNKEIVKHFEKGNKAFNNSDFEDAIKFYNIALDEVGKLVHSLILKENRINTFYINKSHEVKSEEFYILLLASAIKGLAINGEKSVLMPDSKTAKKILQDKELVHKTFGHKDSAIMLYPAYIAHFYRFLISNDIFARIIFNCGITRLKMKENEKAEKYFETSIEFTPKNSSFIDAPHYLGVLKKGLDSVSLEFNGIKISADEKARRIEMPKTAQEAYNEILNHIQKQGSVFSSWYCGITENIENRLHGDHKVPKENHWLIYIECVNSNSARSVEKTLLDKGCDGGTGGGDNDAVFVYAYLRTSITSP